MTTELELEEKKIILFGINEFTINFLSLLSKKDEKNLFLKKIILIDTEDILYEKYKKNFKFIKPIFVKDFKEIFNSFKFSTFISLKFLKKEEKKILINFCLEFEINFIDTNNEEKFDYILKDEDLNEKLKKKKIFFIFGINSNLILFNLISKFLNKKFELKNIEFYHQNLNSNFGELFLNFFEKENLIKIKNEKEFKIDSILKNIKYFDSNKQEFKTDHFVDEEEENFEEISLDEKNQFFKGNLIPIYSNEILTCQYENKIKNISSFYLKKDDLIFNFFLFFFKKLFCFNILFFFIFNLISPIFNFFLNKIKFYLFKINNTKNLISFFVKFETKKNLKGILKLESKDNEIDLSSLFLFDLLKNLENETISNSIFGLQTFTTLNFESTEKILKKYSKISFAFDQDLKFDFLIEKFDNLRNENLKLKKEMKNLKEEIELLKNDKIEMKDEILILKENLNTEKKIVKEDEEGIEPEKFELKNYLIEQQKDEEILENEDKIEQIDEFDDAEEGDDDEEEMDYEDDDEEEEDEEFDENEEKLKEKDEKDFKNEKIVQRIIEQEDAENKGEKLENFQTLIEQTAKKEKEKEEKKNNQTKGSPYFAIGILLGVLSIGLFYSLKFYNSYQNKQK